MHDRVHQAITDLIHDVQTQDYRRLPPRYFCSECDKVAESYMVKNEVWGQAFPTPRGICCITCLQEKLGRDLTYEDLKPAPINLSILRGMLMGAD